MPSLSFESLTSTEFEEFTFDLLTELGHKNVDWRKGTGHAASPADQGRDIESDELRRDPDGREWHDRWFTDCKHYVSGVPPTELQNLISWAQAERPQVALFVASNYLSNGAKTWIKDFVHNNNPPFRIVTWELPQLAKMSEGRDDLLAKYGLSQSRTIASIKEQESEHLERVWFQRKLNHMARSGMDGADLDETTFEAMEEIRERHGEESLGPFTDFEWGMINGKLSALRWVLGSEWDELDS